MPRPLAAKRFTSALVPLVLTLVRKHGHDTRALEKKFLPHAEVTLDELGALLGEVAKVLKDPLFGLHCALSMGRGSYGLLEFALRAAPTGRLALEQLATYGALINPLVRWSLEVDGEEVSLHHRAPHPGGVGPQANVFTVARILQIAREMLGDDLVPTRAWFAHDARECPPELAKVLGTKAIAFGRASNGLSFDAKSLQRVPVGADAELNRALERHGQAMLAQAGNLDDAWERVRAVMAELLPRGPVTLAKTAKKLHVTPRTLQRRLGEQGASFASMLSEVRRAQAERLLLRTDASLDQVAEQVGYADTAAFVRAFRTWTGTTPGKFRVA